eukprot:3630714-Heterocapsa_arctica.AAC.1
MRAHPCPRLAGRARPADLFRVPPGPGRGGRRPLVLPRDGPRAGRCLLRSLRQSDALARIGG